MVSFTCTAHAALIVPQAQGCFKYLNVNYLLTPQSPRVAWRGRSSSKFQSAGVAPPPRGQRFLWRERRRPEQIIATLQFLRPEISAEISAKTVILSPKLSSPGVSTKLLSTDSQNQPLEMNLRFISSELYYIGGSASGSLIRATLWGRSHRISGRRSSACGRAVARMCGSARCAKARSSASSGLPVISGMTALQ